MIKAQNITHVNRDQSSLSLSFFTSLLLRFILVSSSLLSVYRASLHSSRANRGFISRLIFLATLGGGWELRLLSLRSEQDLLSLDRREIWSSD